MVKLCTVLMRFSPLSSTMSVMIVSQMPMPNLLNADEDPSLSREDIRSTGGNLASDVFINGTIDGSDFAAFGARFGFTL